MPFCFPVVAVFDAFVLLDAGIFAVNITLFYVASFYAYMFIDAAVFCNFNCAMITSYDSTFRDGTPKHGS